jgi:hypothetical protein
MYGYGYRYPRVPRRVEAHYTDPEYRYKWTRAAIMNKAVAARSPCFKFLRENGYFDDIRRLLRKAAAEYRGEPTHGFTDKDKTIASKRKTKLENAIKALSDEAIRSRLASEFGPKYNPAYAEARNKTPSRYN